MIAQSPGTGRTAEEVPPTVACRSGDTFVDTPKPYEFIRFGDISGTKPCEFVGFGDIGGPKPYECIGFGDIGGPKPYEFIGSYGNLIFHRVRGARFRCSRALGTARP